MKARKNRFNTKIENFNTVPAGYKDLECKVCHIEWIEVTMDVGAIICDRCVALMVGPPEEIKPKPPITGYPRGWHLKSLFIDNGKYFSKGKEITKKEANLLINPTPVPSEEVKKPLKKPKKIKKASKKIVKKHIRRL